MPIAKIVPKGKPKSNEEAVLLLSDDQAFTTRLLQYEDVGLGDPDYETHPPVKVVNWRTTRDGRKVRRRRTLRGEKISEIMYEMNLAEGHTADPYLKAVTRGNCSRTVFVYDPCVNAFTAIQNAVFDEIRKRVTPLQSASEDGAPLSHYTKFYGSELEYEELGFYTQQTAIDEPLYAVAFKFPSCADCDPLDHQDGVYGGAARLVVETSNQFATGTAVTAAIPVGTIATDILVDGEVTYVSFTDNLTPASATAGGVVKIVGGVSTTVLSIGNGLYCLAQSNQYIWAFGADGLIYKSASGNSFTLITNAVMASTHFKKAAYDPKTDAIYLAGDDGTDGKAGKFDGQVLTDISANVGTLTAKKLTSVKVLSKDTDDFSHIAFGGESGFYAENGDAENSNTYTVVVIPPAASDAITLIEGDSWLTVVGGATKVYVRAIYTNMEFEHQHTVTGTITDGDTGITDYGVNHIVIVTNVSGTSGNIYLLRPAVSAL